jgi:sortase A
VGRGWGGGLIRASNVRDEDAPRNVEPPPAPAPPHKGEGWRLLALLVLLTGLIFVAAALYIPAKAQLAQILMARAWRHELATGLPMRPWSWADFTPAAKLDFPAQHRSILALSDASGESLAFGPTLMAASAKPGERGVAVFAAHRDTHFAFLGHLKPGDPIRVETRDATVTYRITGAEVVRWNASGIQPHDNGPARIALVTCWPLDGNFHGVLRYVVWGELERS